MARAPRDMDAEEIPEADRLAGFPHPRFATELFGHDQAVAELAGAFASGRLHHGWLVTGPRGVGKATLAYRFARHALSEASDRGSDDRLSADPEGRGARQVVSLAHPSLLVIRRPYDLKDKRFRTAITIDEVRKLREFLGHTSGGGGWRVVIVDQADELNANAANALLKSLEEPPARCVFFLISSEPGRLLPTIRSRCRRLALERLGPDDLSAAVRQAFSGAEDTSVPDEATWARLGALADGSVRRFLELAGSGGAGLSSHVASVLSGLGRPRAWQDIHRLADELSPQAAQQSFETFCDLLLAELGGRIKAAAVGRADATLPGGQLATWAELWETIVREKADVMALNLDRKSFILETVARLDMLAAGRAAG